MGFCLSYCRRPSTDDDREPLLSRPPEAAVSEDIPPPQSHVDKVADVFGALHVGKLPSQDQINAALQKVLRSQVLTVEANKSSRVLGRQKQQYGPLSERGKMLLRDVRELVEAMIQFGLEKNDDDRVQDLIHQNVQLGSRPVAVDLDAAKDTEAADDIHTLATAIPSFQELDKDTQRLSDSLLTLSRVLLTSSTFRFLLSDVLLTSRQLLADAAAQVGEVAHTVEAKAGAVEEAVRPGDAREARDEASRESLDEAAKQVQDGFKDIGKDTKEKWDNMGTDVPDHLKKSVAESVQKVIIVFPSHPLISFLIYLLSKYVERVNAATSAMASISTSTTTVPTPVITTDPHLKRALTDLRMLLERLASGRSLSPLIYHLERTLRDITNASSPKFQSHLRQFFIDLRSGIERALGEPGFATSVEGRQLAEQLYERGQALMRSNVPWSAEANKALDEVDAFIQALASDRTTRRVIDALEKLSNDFAELFKTTAGVAMKRQRVWREELKADLLGWVLPRALSILKTIPMARVELKSDELELAVDALVLSTTASFLPDHVLVQNWNEVRMEASAAVVDDPYANGSGVHAATRTRVHVDGLRVSAHHVGYYVQYKGPLGGLISWEDSGLVDIDVGRQDAAGQGLSVEIELETLPADEDADQQPVFIVNDVRVDVRGLHVSIRKSRHWILNTILLQPLAGPVVRRVVRRVLASQIRAGLEHVSEKLSAVRVEVKRRAEAESKTDGGPPGIEDYWKAMCATMGSPPADDDADDSDDQASSRVETDTQVTLRGVIRNTRTTQQQQQQQTNAESASPTTPTETLVAVGIGAQILPGKGGPEPEVGGSAAEQARGARVEVGDAAEHVAGKAKAVADDAVGTAGAARESLEDASARMEARERVEAKKKGWRSRAFDF